MKTRLEKIDRRHKSLFLSYFQLTSAAFLQNALFVVFMAKPVC